MAVLLIKDNATLGSAQVSGPSQPPKDKLDNFILQAAKQTLVITHNNATTTAITSSPEQMEYGEDVLMYETYSLTSNKLLGRPISLCLIC